MKAKLRIPNKISGAWNIDKGDILESSTKSGTGEIFKFCYHVGSGEFLCAIAPMHHNIMALAFGSYKIGEYIRGIYFKEKKIVYLRGHEREDWLEATAKMLRQYGVPVKVRVIWGEKAAKRLAKDLEGL